MNRSQLQRLRDYVNTAEHAVFDCIDLVESSGSRIERYLQIGVDAVADALDNVDRLLNRLPPAVSGGPAEVSQTPPESRSEIDEGDYVWVQRRVLVLHPDGYLGINDGSREEHSTDVIPDSPRLPELARWLNRTPSAWLAVQLLVDVADQALVLKNAAAREDRGLIAIKLFDRLEAIDTEHRIAIRALIEALETPPKSEDSIEGSTYEHP